MGEAPSNPSENQGVWTDFHPAWDASELKKYLRPDILQVDELGYLPIDKAGADFLFQVFSQRYEHGSTIVTTNQAYKHWAKMFNNDPSLTSALLDRLLHHAETVRIEGKSYRMKDQIEEP